MSIILRKATEADLEMAHALQQAREAGCYKPALSSNAHRAGAHAFYESLGFAQHSFRYVIET
jgi:GNAT superfamily N-acetyltransferase